MVSYVLIFVALTGAAPATLGTYSSLDNCNRAIRAIHEAKFYLPGSPRNPQIERAIDIQIQYSRQYTCVPK